MTRGKNKFHSDFSSPDIFKYYCEEAGNKKGLTQKQFTTITKEFFAEVINLLIYDNIEFTFPGRLGNLRVLKFRNKFKLNKEGNLDKRKLRPNWKATKDLWKKIYAGKSWEEITALDNKPIVFHENKHSDGYNFKWYWDKLTCTVPNHTAYSIDISRKNDRKLAKALQDEDNDLNYYTQ